MSLGSINRFGSVATNKPREVEQLSAVGKNMVNPLVY